MSFILDALKKSESERQRQSGPALLEMRIVRPARALPAWAMVVGALLIVSVAVLAWMALRPATQRAHETPQPAAAPAQPGATDVNAVAANAGTGAATEPVAPAAPAPAAGQASSADKAAAANTAAAAAADTPVNPADSVPAVAPDPDASRPAGTGGNLRAYAELSGTVPELRLDLHVYAPNPAERYAFINMHRVREGDVTPEGVLVRQITREGVVLEYQGAEFLLGR
jgi:general secretion pathway protein B